MLEVDPKERPQDQEWVHVEEFERYLYEETSYTAPVRRITNGPAYHWFGYYDKFQTDPQDRFVLGMEVPFDKRPIRQGESILVGLVDRSNGDEWSTLGETTAWGWQQGCMLQWMPASDREIVYNTHVQGRLGACIYDVTDRKPRMIPHPVYHLHPSRRLAISLDFTRIQRLRPGYGYWAENGDDISEYRPRDNGIWLTDLDGGTSELAISIADVAAIPYFDEDPEDDIHYFNHAQWSPTGERFLFLNRRRSATGRFEGFRTRMLTASASGDDIRVVYASGQISHFVWRDGGHINLWVDGAFRLIADSDKPDPAILWPATNGHQSYLSPPNLLVADTYADEARFQNLYLYDLEHMRPRRIGRFYLPPDFVGEWRCDLHPRLSRDGSRLFIDSAHEGIGRQIYEIELMK